MAGEASTVFHSNNARSEIEFIMDHHELAGQRNTSASLEWPKRSTGLIHERGRDCQGNSSASDGDFSQLRSLVTFNLQRSAMTLHQEMNGIGANVVTGAVILRPGIPETNNEP